MKTPLHEEERRALAHLKRTDPKLYAAALPYRGTVTSRVSPKHTAAALFESLVSSIVSQQLSTKAADSIFTRVKSILDGKITSQRVHEATPELLRTAGLSAAKVRSLKELAQAIETKQLVLLSLAALSSEEATKQLTGIYGIGPWTAEMFLLFALGAPDVFSPGDLILERQMREALALPASVSKKELARIAERWSPHRSYVSLLFWKLHHAALDAKKENPL